MECLPFLVLREIFSVSSVTSVVKIFHPAELEYSTDTGVAFARNPPAPAPLRIARCDSGALRPKQVYLFQPKLSCSFVIGRKGRLTVNLDVWYVPAAIHLSCRKFE